MTAPPPFDRRAVPPGLAFSAWHAPDGWEHRRFDWPADGPVRGSLLFMSGRADFAEKYFEALAHWHGRGWNVAGFDWRGQGGSGRILPGVEAGHLASFDPLVDDLSGFVAQWRAAMPGPHVLIGHSMGGHLVLRAIAEGRAGADAVVLVAPMLGIKGGAIGRLIAFLAGLFGATMRPIARTLDDSLRQKRLTGSVERFQDAAWWRTSRPELGLGPPTWGWLHAAYDSLARIRRPGVLAGIATPVLVLRARADAIVRTGLARRIAGARVVTLDGAHELLREADPVRLAALAEIDRFLDERAPAR